MGARLTWPLLNVWLGVSCEDQRAADARVPDLLATPAAVRFVSAEPLLGAISFRKWLTAPDDDRLWQKGLIDWIIVGGESGPGARPMHPDWARSIRNQCIVTGVAFFFKQWGEWANGSNFESGAMAVLRDGRVLQPDPETLATADAVSPVARQNPTLMRRVGKRAAGRMLDGQTHDAFPEPRS